MSCGQAYVGVQGGGQAPQQGDGGLGSALFDALDLVGGQGRPPGQPGDAQPRAQRWSYTALPKARA